jgi:PAS domain S-box-containing protein
MASDDHQPGLDHEIRESRKAVERAQADLATSEARYRRLFETALDGIILLNFDTAQIEDVNPYLIKMLGYSHKEFLGRKIWEVGAFSDLPESKDMFSKLQTEGYVRYEDLPLVASDGNVIDVEFISNSYDCEGTKVIQCNIRDIRERKLIADLAREHLEKQKQAFMNTVDLAIEISSLHDRYTVGHARNVALIAVAIGRALGFDEARLEGLKIEGALHDIGKIAVPLELLSKPGALSEVEFQLVKTHPKAGYDLLSRMEWPWPVAEVAYQHHERMDGSGYPNGLKGDEILLESRIIAVADVVEAMTSHRPYRPGFGIDQALSEIERGSGTLYDSVVADACLRIFREDGFTFLH